MRRSPSATRASAALLLAASLLLEGCGSRESLQPVLAESCSPFGGAQPTQLQVVPPVSGALRVAITQRGISVVASSGAVTARSPVDRYGLVTLVVDARRNQPVPVTVATRDSPDVTGEICVAADLLPAGDTKRLRAERAFAAAGRSAQAEDWRRAFELYGNAVRSFHGIDDLRVAQARHAMSWISYWNLRNDEGAYVLAQWALADFGANADPGVQSSLLALEASTFLEQQRFTVEERRDHVLGLLAKAEDRARLAKFGTRELPRFEILRGFMDWGTGHTSEAGDRFMGAAKSCENQRDWECAARARQNLAAIAEEGRDYPAALQSSQLALASMPPDLDRTLRADIVGNYGRIQSISGLFRQAEHSHRLSITLHADLGDCDGTRMASARLGTLLVQVGNVNEGRVYLARAASLECKPLIEAARQETATDADSAGIVEVQTPSARIEDCVGSPAGDTLSEPGMIAVFNALLGLHDAARLEGEMPLAARCLRKARDYAGTARTKLRFANAEGAAFVERGEAARADAAFARGLAIADAAQIPAAHEHRSLAWLGRARTALLDKRADQAHDFAARALTLGAARGDLRQVTDALQLMARGFIADGEAARAATILRVAADLIEQVPIDDLDAEQRATWLATQHSVFEELTMLLAKDAGNDETRAWQAFEVSERGRARSLRYAMSQATDTRATSSSEPASPSARYRELMGQITALGRETQQSANGQPLSVDALAELIAQRAAPQESVLTALQQRLAALDATIVEYAAGEDNVLAFVISGTHIRVVALGRRADVMAAATGLYERVRNPESAASDVRSSAQRLAELALWPVTDLVTGRRVIFIPDDALHTVPFAVLPWSAARDAPLLIQRMELSVMPATLFITHASTHALLAGAPRLELIGDPVFHKADWQRECHLPSAPSTIVANRERSGIQPISSLPRLPGSRDEVAGIADLARRAAPKSDIREHLGCEATPQALRDAAASSPTLLHIATHGYVDAFRPRLSALVLTPDGESNGTFGLLDILKLKIDSRLVVLSACDTSRGRLLPGEGVLGPAQAFLQAGASSVVASYWRISDQATAQFMRTFYRHLLLEHLPAAAALREAQLDYASQGGSHDWAAFTLFGWPDSRL
jgi:CHAT domain-containing protein